MSIEKMLCESKEKSRQKQARIKPIHSNVFKRIETMNKTADM
jgi:hypothetical protein